MTIKSEHEFDSALSMDSIKLNLRRSYESGDILKYEEFNSKYKTFSKFAMEGLKTHQFINDPNIKYLGKFYQGNFELRSPRLFYWTNVLVYVRHKKKGARLHIKLINFWIIILPLFLLFSLGLLITIMDFSSGILVLIISVLVLTIQLIKVSKTLAYFRQKAFKSY